MKHTISCLVRNEPGVLAHVARRFGDEGINIYSLAAGTTEDDAVSRMTIVVDGDDATVVLGGLAIGFQVFARAGIGGCRPFIGGFDPRKKFVGGHVNAII